MGARDHDNAPSMNKQGSSMRRNALENEFPIRVDVLEQNEGRGTNVIK